jgi:peptidoglycan/LPS O-acetylase OafA/YrhL
LEYLGERSYSVYLLHPIVIVLLKNPIQNLYTALTPYFGTYAYFICVLATLGPLLLLAETTYQLIEVPGIAIGKKVNSRARDRESTLSEDSQDRSGEARKHLL